MSPSMWTTAGVRNSGQGAAPGFGSQSSMASHPQTQASQQQSQLQRDDLFASSSQLPDTQSGHRFNGQHSAIGQTQSNGADDFPPLARNLNGNIGQDRGSTMLQSFGNGHQHPSVFGNMTAQNGAFLNTIARNGREASGSARATSPSTYAGKSIRLLSYSCI